MQLKIDIKLVELVFARGVKMALHSIVHPSNPLWIVGSPFEEAAYCHYGVPVIDKSRVLFSELSELQEMAVAEHRFVNCNVHRRLLVPFAGPPVMGRLFRPLMSVIKVSESTC